MRIPGWIEDLLPRAIREAGGQNALARRLNVNHNSPRQWLLGIALPTPERYAGLAELTGVSPEVVAQSVMAARRRRWEARWLPVVNPPQGATGSPGAPSAKPAPPTARSRRRGRAVGGLVLALSSLLAALAAPRAASAGHPLGVGPDSVGIPLIGPWRRWRAHALVPALV